jgi:hypothetical protein
VGQTAWENSTLCKKTELLSEAEEVFRQSIYVSVLSMFNYLRVCEQW